jgi:hypothetical protein
MSSINDALAHLDDALDALTVEAYTATFEQVDNDDWQRCSPVQATLALELERIDQALGPAGKSMFAPIAEEIKRAVIAIVAAQNALTGKEAA